jgi:hypothetical protein
MPTDEDYGVWVGLRRCGCCRAVTVDNPAHRKEVEQDKRDFLRSGLSVVYGTWQEWLTRYGPTMKSICPHEAAEQAEP